MKFGDVRGIDSPWFGKATWAAIKTLGGGEYKREELIPEVTRLVSKTAAEFDQAIKQDKSGLCRPRANVLVGKKMMKASK